MVQAFFSLIPAFFYWLNDSQMVGHFAYSLKTKLGMAFWNRIRFNAGLFSLFRACKPNNSVRNKKFLTQYQKISRKISTLSLFKAFLEISHPETFGLKLAENSARIPDFFKTKWDLVKASDRWSQICESRIFSTFYGFFFFFFTHLGYFFNFTVVYLCQIKGGISPPSGGKNSE